MSLGYILVCVILFISETLSIKESISFPQCPAYCILEKNNVQIELKGY